MAPALNPRSGFRMRRSQLSGGAIAGTVIGSLIGGSLLFIVLGFLYFRYRRKLREAKEAGTLPTGSSPGNRTKSIFNFGSFLPGQTPATGPDHLPSTKDDLERIGPGFSDGSEFQQTQPAVYGHAFVRDHESYYPSQDFGQLSLHPGVNFSPPPQLTAFPTTNDPRVNLPSENVVTGYEAANSSYYDTRISMGSNPEQETIPPSRQMTELYEAQLRDSRERQRSGSLISRLWNSIKRKRSTHSSAHGTSSPHNSTPQQYFTASPVTSPVSMKPQAGLEVTEGTSTQEKLSKNRFFEEPGEISEEGGISGTSAGGNGSEKDQQNKRQRQGDSQYDVYPLQTSSTIRETTERDSELPSAALRSPDSADRLPHSTQPQSETRPQERLMSPAIPEPMELDDTLDVANRPSVFRSSHSPPLQPESFVSPMSIMQPSNAAEKAAYTHYQMENSASPPTFPILPPAIVTEQTAQENPENPPYGSQDDIDVESFLDIPSDDEPRLSGDSYDYTTTPGQSSTDPSTGRTPDTRLTVSPSPYPNMHEHVKMEPESSSSPEVSKIPSPQSSGHICEECGRYFDQVHKLNHHKRYHDRKHGCPYEGCDKKFGTKTHLDRHINDKHVKSKAYHCIEPTCPYFKGRKAFPRKDNWRRHMIKKHGAMPSDLEAMDESMG
ncbi:uncharacterized protein F4812DRAFT_448784 [Daldinia caldariorum]|uniref:uncharacterized protein n=1 Tax=Daldinia caldariorum TaxID=326644 RepID=UPI0020074035|nr:uncharacterized protein F4812DRAFT_448784 [Daldinia caldariorum]KAI1462892.1 hypothetical protein F4812DRAFT_448784 [Daldinia caldariorum]